MFKPPVSLIIFLISGIMSANADGQASLAPAPADVQAPSYSCQVRKSDETWHVFAARSLDAQGQFLSESIQWAKADNNKPDTGPDLEIRWHPEYGHQSFEKGVVGFLFHDRPRLIGHLQLSLNMSGDNSKAATFDAGAGMPVSSSRASNFAEAYVQAGPLLNIAPDATALHWRLQRLDGYRGKPVELYQEGDLDLTFLKAARTEFPRLIQRLDVMQAKYLGECTKL